MIHPNLQKVESLSVSPMNKSEPTDDNFQAVGQPKKLYKMGCAKYLMRFDEFIMKPMFIYKYHKNKAKDAEELYNAIVEEGNTLEAMYKHNKKAKRPPNIKT